MKITLTINGTDVTFEPTKLAYNSYINDITMNDKVAPATNFLRRTVVSEDKDKLNEILEKHVGAALQIIEKVLKQFAPDLEIEIKN
ncbi:MULTISPECIES: putative phage tail assembly chaperone [unclassified Gilliamella]|uniref:putative phage tail assembly chaperone n=1 Tax=unclassified Gilliamella TaxID=2685620 RepID=UPI0022699A6E|nr:MULTISPECIES: putative phage tail assembly chaperone [unclassified Gilliamella]MCX8587296.1 putative phage tail assembly chaperone [Gilliamella sp. B3801]MCX8591949.1 putative phage tail assembly chaperone [Gilliamella sp. B3804]